MEPSPPATTTWARGVISLVKSSSGSNGTIRWSANSSRSFFSISGVMDPAPVLMMSSLDALALTPAGERLDAGLIFFPLRMRLNAARDDGESWWKSPALTGQAPPRKQRRPGEPYPQGTKLTPGVETQMGVIPGYRRQLEIEGLMGIEDLAGTRPGHGEEVYADRQLVVARTALPAGLRFTGEIDASHAAAVPASLAVSEARDGAV